MLESLTPAFATEIIFDLIGLCYSRFISAKINKIKLQYVSQRARLMQSVSNICKMDTAQPRTCSATRKYRYGL
jgi:hypothetical protein